MSSLGPLRYGRTEASMQSRGLYMSSAEQKCLTGSFLFCGTTSVCMISVDKNDISASYRSWIYGSDTCIFTCIFTKGGLT